jgi:hypothetical protein
MRPDGKARHPSSARISSLVSQIVRKYQDPVGTRRYRGRNRVTDQYHYIEGAAPVKPIYGHTLSWGFVNANDVDTTNVWDESNSGAGTSLTVQDEVGGYAKVTNGGGDNNYYYYFDKYEKLAIATDKDIYLRTRMKVGDVDEADVFIGMCKKLAAGDIFDNRVDAIGFYMADGSAVINCECSKDSTATQTASSVSATDGDEITLMIHVISNHTVEFFINESWAVEIKTNLPDDEEMAFCFGIRNGTGAANTLSVGRTDALMDE